MRLKKTSSLLKISLSVAFLILTFGLSSSYAEFYVIAVGGKKIGTEITSLPYTISTPGFYFITKDLSCPAGTNGITITTSNVTLDLMGFALIGAGEGGDGYHGIHFADATGSRNNEVRNGTIRDFDGQGIRSHTLGSRGHRLFSLRVMYNAEDGISLTGRSHLIKNCICSYNGEFGIYSGEGSFITGNICFNNGDDSIRALSGCTITGNTCYDNKGDGISTYPGCTITGNTCYDNEGDGIEAGVGSTVIGNTCRGNLDRGINLFGDSYVGQNTCTNNNMNMNDCSVANPCAKGLNYAP